MPAMRWLVVVLLCLVSRAASADVGIVVHGEAKQRTVVKKAIEKWLRQHGHDVVDAGLSDKTVATLADCFTVSDLGCARTVVEKHADAESVVSVRVDDSVPEQLQLAGAWITKGRNVVSVQRVCENCSDDAVPGAVESLLQDLARASSGRVRVTSEPRGLEVLLDNEAIGVTPVERDVAVGEHVVKLVRGGRTIGRKKFTVQAGSMLEVDVPVTAEIDPEPSRVLPKFLMVVGIAGMVTGGFLYASTEESSGVDRFYTDRRPAALGVGAGGAVVFGLGVVLWVRSSPSSSPSVALTPNGVYAGWAGTF